MTVAPLPVGSYRLLTYEYVPDMLERRDPYRPAHLEHARRAQERGELLTAGAVGTPPTGALLVFADVAAEVVEAFVEADPYRQAGLVTGYRVQPWSVVV
jgi:uncharacterized protein YciI